MLKLLALILLSSPFYIYIKKREKEKKERKRRKREKEKQERKREKERKKKEERKMLLIKMENLKPISHKEFNEFIKGKGSKGKNENKLKELKAKFGLNPMYDRCTLTISSEDISPTTFDSLRKASKANSISYGVLLYPKNKERNLVKKDEKNYNINWNN